MANPSTSSLNSELLPHPGEPALVSGDLRAASGLGLVVVAALESAGGSSKTDLFRTTVGCTGGTGEACCFAALVATPVAGPWSEAGEPLCCCCGTGRGRTPPRPFGLLGEATALSGAGAGTGAVAAATVTATGVVVAATLTGPRLGKPPLDAELLAALVAGALLTVAAVVELVAGAGRGRTPAADAAEAAAELEGATLPTFAVAVTVLAGRCACVDCWGRVGGRGASTMSTSTNSTGGSAFGCCAPFVTAPEAFTAGCRSCGCLPSSSGSTLTTCAVAGPSS